MSIQINRGLYLSDGDFLDHHAVLGVPIGTEPKEVRKRYLRIARRLHPDSLTSASPEERELATQILSKQVNPAYELLCNDKNRKEYLLTLSLKAQQLRSQGSTISLAKFCDQAKQLAKSSGWELEYMQVVKTIAEKQYDDLNQVVDAIGRLSEVNFVYAIRREATGNSMAGTSRPSSPSPVTTTAATPAPASQEAEPTMVQSSASRVSIVDGYLRRAEEYLRKRALAQALLEARDAVRAAPNDSRCHSLTGKIYLLQDQLKMAFISTKRALDLDAKNSDAIQLKQILKGKGFNFEDDASPPATGAGKKPKNSDSPAGGAAKKSPKPTSKDGGGGFLGGLFGKKR